MFEKPTRSYLSKKVGIIRLRQIVFFQNQRVIFVWIFKILFDCTVLGSAVALSCEQKIALGDYSSCSPAWWSSSR